MTAESAKRLISFKEFARRLGGVSVRTVDRLYAAETPGLPPIVRLASLKMIDESEADRFVATVIKKGGLPGQERFAPRGAAAQAAQAARQPARQMAPKSTRRQVAPKTPRRARVEG